MSHLHQPTIDYLLKFNPPGKKTFLAKIVKAFREDMAARFTEAHGLLGRRDAAALAKSLHAICGSCRNVGAQDLAGVMQAMERDAAKGNLCATEKLAEAEATCRIVIEELQAYLD